MRTEVTNEVMELVEWKTLDQPKREIVEAVYRLGLSDGDSDVARARDDWVKLGYQRGYSDGRRDGGDAERRGAERREERRVDRREELEVEFEGQGRVHVRYRHAEQSSARGGGAPEIESDTGGFFDLPRAEFVEARPGGRQLQVRGDREWR